MHLLLSPSRDTSVRIHQLRQEYRYSYRRLFRTAHLNLREDYLPYKYLIGQVVLDVSLHASEVVCLLP